MKVFLFKKKMKEKKKEKWSKKQILTELKRPTIVNIQIADILNLLAITCHSLGRLNENTFSILFKNKEKI